MSLKKNTKYTHSTNILLHGLYFSQKVVAYGEVSFYTKTWKCIQNKILKNNEKQGLLKNSSMWKRAHYTTVVSNNLADNLNSYF